MPRKPIWKIKILETLEEGSFNYNTLFNKVKNKIMDSERETYREKYREFDEPMIKLLEEGKVVICGYDASVNVNKKGKPLKKKQSIKKEGLKFELVKPMYIEDVRVLLNQIESSNPRKIKSALKKLQNLFNMKFIQYEKLENEYWENKIKTLKNMPIEDMIRKLNDDLEGDISYLRRIFIIEQIANVRIVRSKAKDDGTGKYFTKNFLDEEDFKMPSRKSNSEINRMFNDIIFYINSLENNRFLKNAFSLALSDDEESIDFFKLFLKENYNSESKTKISEVLNIKALNEQDPNVRNYNVHKKYDEIGKGNRFKPI